MRQVPHPESVADHLHRVAMMSMLYHDNSPNSSTESDSYPLDYSDCPELHPDRIDPVRLLRMALTHDLCEAIAGDITPHCAETSSRRDWEQQAMQHIARIVGGGGESSSNSLGTELASLWQEYEDQSTPLAVVVKDLDKFEMLTQALEYEMDHLCACPLHVDPLLDTPSSSASVDEPPFTVGVPILLPPAIAVEPLRDFFQRQQGQFKTPLFRKLDAELRARRLRILAEKGWDATAGEK